MNRRRFIGLAGAGAVALAGCMSSSGTDTPQRSDGPAQSTPTPTETEAPTPTPTETPKPDYDVEQIKANAGEVPYDDLLRDIEGYQGLPIHIEAGQVAQVIEHGNDEYTFRIYVGGPDESWDDDVVAHWVGDRFIEDDYVELWAIVDGPYTYETVLGNQRTVPGLTIVDIELREDLNE